MINYKALENNKKSALRNLENYLEKEEPSSRLRFLESLKNGINKWQEKPPEGRNKSVFLILSEVPDANKVASDFFNNQISPGRDTKEADLLNFAMRLYLGNPVYNSALKEATNINDLNEIKKYDPVKACSDFIDREIEGLRGNESEASKMTIEGSFNPDPEGKN